MNREFSDSIREIDQGSKGLYFDIEPDNINQVKEMYSKSSVGALTDEEINYLTMVGQGDALLMVDASTRVSFHVSLKNQIEESKFILQESKTNE